MGVNPRKDICMDNPNTPENNGNIEIQENGEQNSKSEPAKYNDFQLNNIVKKEKMKLLKSLGFSDLSEAKSILSEYLITREQAEHFRKIETEAENYKIKLYECQKKLLIYQQKEIASNNGVNEKDLDVVICEVNKRIIMNLLFEKVLKSFLSENPMY